jgi:hypothetical protein
LNGISSKLDGIDTLVATKIDEVVNRRGAELRGGAVADSLKITRELSKIDARHQREFGEDLDDTKLEAHIAAAKEAGRPFRTVTDAYDDMTREARTAKEVDKRVAEAKKEVISSATVPGVSGTQSSPVLRMMKSAGRKAGDAGTVADRAGEALRARLAERGEQVA